MKKIFNFNDFEKEYDFKKLGESFSHIFENIQSEIEEITSVIDIETISDENPDKIAALLSKLIDADGDLDDVDINDVKENYKDIIEREDINENEGGLVYVLEVVGTIMGNADLIHFIGDVTSKKLGRKVDVSKLAETIKKIVDFIKKATGYPAKIVKKFFEFIAKKFKMDIVGQKIMGLTGLAVATVCMLAIGLIFFPAASAITGTSGLITILLSFTAVIGKIIEITVIIQEVIKVMRLEIEKKVSSEKPSEKEIDDAIGSMTLEI